MSRTITVIVALVGLVNLQPRADGQELRYGCKPGERYLYSVKIEIEGEDIVEELNGTSSYTVRAADQDGITLVHSGRLFPTRRAKQGLVPLIVPGRLGFGGPFSGVGIGMPNESKLRIDAFGKVVRSSGESQLPAMLGNLSDLVIEHHADCPTSGRRPHLLVSRKFASADLASGTVNFKVVCEGSLYRAGINCGTPFDPGPWVPPGSGGAAIAANCPSSIPSAGLMANAPPSNLLTVMLYSPGKTSWDNS